ncbi:hypothetical protein NHX12_034161 [Muraenolepis orangiensis]|uniref:Uncharacterized protein n=1 Tax=Muraenolepis orangiensis TaxID=630683 RepID=A0A9Q0E192_9TELE|nr:hypothetical protein NHX12_034161 [Muraenolepis orangiensis]
MGSPGPRPTSSAPRRAALWTATTAAPEELHPLGVHGDARVRPRNESPGRIRHPVHSVQRLFTKSHSLPSGGRWSSDDNLDSDSTYRTPSVMSRHPPEHLSHCYPLDAVQAHLAGDLTLKTSRSNNDVKCSACDGVAMS